ncbi:alkylation response protein AidB-like acyl-CoA dehydrogenase [Mesonia algae]|uniref:Alkylation response protein AidB-like acyl-CoA dehydrogenase n=1 Tax=Mesonia algae TaxID=213248 RepID=A0A2W7K1J8_9FLAO|nr:hypothetical protein [Mesonia algae]PZW41480.1 alkylation response protein AidB-like acyl-CoA dehydrogenase [Mesonia algae]
MWDDAIKAIKDNNTVWIKENRIDFQHYFQRENCHPQGKLSALALEKHYSAKLFKMFLGKNYNGLALSLDEGAKWIENASFLDGNWGWLLGIGVGGAYFADYCDKKTAQTYFSLKNALVAGSGKPSGKLTSLPNGYALSGSWKYCSGSEQASLFTAVTIKEEKPIAIIIPSKSVIIKKDWNAIGLPLTCSHYIETQKAFIPKNHLFDLSTRPRYNEYPISTYPFMEFALACFTPVMIGITKNLFEDISEFVSSKKEIWKNHQPERYEFISTKILEIKTHLENTSSLFYHKLKKSWQDHLKEQQSNLESDLSSISKELAAYCYEESFQLIPLLGMVAIENDTSIQRQFKNLQTAYQHMIFRNFS